MAEKRITNTHTHVFTSQFVPPFLAKTIVPWPLYFLIHTRWIVGLAKRYYRYKYRLKFPAHRDSKDDWEAIYKARRNLKSNTLWRYNLRSNRLLYIPYGIIIFWLSVVALLYTIEFLTYLFGLSNNISAVFETIEQWLSQYYLFFKLPLWAKIVWVLFVLIWVNWSRRVIWFAVKSLFPIFKKIVNTKGMELLERYLLMGRFALYKSQKEVAQRALHQLPPNSQMVILPMDMEYMGAGKTKIRKDILETKQDNLNKGWTEYDYQDTYKYQMRELWEFVKSNASDSYRPFLFVDPRRVKTEGTAFFDYTLVGGKMQLNECFVKTYMEDRNFGGFKIYPALGYYPFDEHLLPIWRYAAENNIPIMTHCVMGVIYYRGRKKKKWNFHPVFKQQYDHLGKVLPEPMLLPQVKNVEMQFNFTHPLNYLCLLEEKLLNRVLGQVKNQKVKDLFGYVDKDTPLTHTLKNLKVCFAHYGGEEEWIKFLETDRDVYARRMFKNPDEGIIFMKNTDGDFSEDKINSLWHDTDWYSIISSILMHYPNIYADLSYIISKPSIYPLLNHTLEKGEDYDAQHKLYLAEPSPNKKAACLKGRNRLRSHILYGTDFYVVRNHNSDKDLFVEATTAIGKENFDLVARENPFNYLSRD